MRAYNSGEIADNAQALSGKCAVLDRNRRVVGYKVLATIRHQRPHVDVARDGYTSWRCNWGELCVFRDAFVERVNEGATIDIWEEFVEQDLHALTHDEHVLGSLKDTILKAER